MLFGIIVLMSSLPLSSAFYQTLTNVQLSIEHFNNSRCLNDNVNNTNLIFFCTDSVNQCCQDNLDKISPFTDPKYNFCYDFEVNNSELFVKYDCNEAEITDITTMEILSFIALILLCILGLICVTKIVSCIFCRKKNSYNEF